MKLGWCIQQGAAIAVLILVLTSGLRAEDSGRRFDNLPWMKINVGARAQALGGAFTARAEDGTAPHWNPALLETLTPYDTEICAAALPLTLERRAGFASYIQRLGEARGTLAVSWHYFRVGAIEERDADGTHLGDWEDLENAVSVSYARTWGADWKMGGTLHYYSHLLPGAEGRGIGMDLAAAYQPKGPWLRWQFGATLKELSPGIFWGTGTRETVWPTIRLGGAYHILYSRLIASVDLELPLGQKAIPHAGIEWWAWEPVALRAGLDAFGMHVGAGYCFGPYQVDYSFSALLEGLSDEHRIALMYKL